MQWKGRDASAFKLRIEMRGGHEKEPTILVTEKTVKPPKLFRKWSVLEVTGEDYKKFGELLAWRATLWDGDKLLAEQKSFLW